MTPEKIHTKAVPALYAILWTIALFAGIAVSSIDMIPVLLRLTGIFIVFLVFIWESAIMFLDVKCVHSRKNFDGELLSINTKLFFIIPLPFIIGAFYYAWEYNWLFYLTILTMGWIKWACSYFANNIEAHFVDIKPTFRPNKIND